MREICNARYSDVSEQGSGLLDDETFEMTPRLTGVVIFHRLRFSISPPLQAITGGDHDFVIFRDDTTTDVITRLAKCEVGLEGK